MDDTGDHFCNPVLLSASTITNKPATSGSTAQDTPLTTGQGFFLALTITIAEVSVPVIAVGKPSCISKAEAINKIIAVAAMPVMAVLPPCDNPGIIISVLFPVLISYAG